MLSVGAQQVARVKEAIVRTAVPSAPFPHICAHRGLSHACPENTLPAFAAAMAVGAHEIEFDLWLSRDGVLVVCHDPTVDRTTDGQGSIAEMDWEDIRLLDIDAFGDVWRGIRIPRLEQVMDLADGRIGLNIHLKDPGPDGQAVRKVCDLLRRSAVTDIAYIAAEDEAALSFALEYDPGVARDCLASQADPVHQIEMATHYACQRIHCSRRTTEEHIRIAHEAGLICNMFTTDDVDEAKEGIRRGMDVILTNRAQRLLAGGLLSLHQQP
jgi:glycerophosphoryl diester phosphodiesterase